MPKKQRKRKWPVRFQSYGTRLNVMPSNSGRRTWLILNRDERTDGIIVSHRQARRLARALLDAAASPCMQDRCYGSDLAAAVAEAKRRWEFRATTYILNATTQMVAWGPGFDGWVKR